MSENESTSRTISTPAEGETPNPSDLSCVNRCNELVSEYRDQKNGKADTVLELREVLLESPSVKGGQSLNDALAVYLGILDEVDETRRQAEKRGVVERGSEVQAQRENRRLDSAEENENGGIHTRDEADSDDEDQRIVKRAKTVDPTKFPWFERRSAALASLPADIRQTYEQLENFAADPKQVVLDILSTPGCPPFPPGEWLNVVKWKYVDLAKVLDSAHTTELDPKRTHVIDDEVELAFRVSKSSGSIKSASDHSIAFNMYIQAISFVFPQRVGEFVKHQTYISRLFHSTEPRHHSRIIEFDKAVRNQVAMQRDLRLTDHSQFEELKITFLSSIGVGTNSSSSAAGSGGRTNRREGVGGRDDPCHKWNRGTCNKSEGECRYSHCCDRRGCRGAHRKSECPRQGGSK